MWLGLSCGQALTPLSDAELDAAAPDAGDGRAPNHVAGPPVDCAALRDDANFCLVAQDSDDPALVWLSLESGRTCQTHARVRTDGSIAQVGNYVYACAQGDEKNDPLDRVSLVDGTVDTVTLDGYCEGVAAWGTRIVVSQSLQSPSEFAVYETFEDIPHAPLTRIRSALGASRIAITGDHLFGVRDQGDEVAVLDLATGKDLPRRRLAGLRGPIVGFGATRAGELVVKKPPSGGSAVEVRDPTTGALLRTVPVENGDEVAMTCGGAPN